MHRKLLLCLAISAALVACKQESPTVAATPPGTGIHARLHQRDHRP